MSCVHYKFKSSLEYQTVTFDWLHISIGDLKKAISQHKKLKTGEYNLEITNAQTRKGVILYLLQIVIVSIVL